MANIGAGETYIGYYVEKDYITKIDSLLKNSQPIEDIIKLGFARAFRYRYLTSNEMLSQPLSAWIKAQYENIIHTSETDIEWKIDSLVYTEDGKRHVLKAKIPQRQIAMFSFSKKQPHILELQ